MWASLCRLTSNSSRLFGPIAASWSLAPVPGFFWGYAIGTGLAISGLCSSGSWEFSEQLLTVHTCFLPSTPFVGNSCLLPAPLFKKTKPVYFFIWLRWVLFSALEICVASCRIFPGGTQALIEAHRLQTADSVIVVWLFSCSEACGILVNQPGIRPTFPWVARQILNHWTTREMPPLFFKFFFLLVCSHFTKLWDGLEINAWVTRARCNWKSSHFKKWTEFTVHKFGLISQINSWNVIFQ